MCPSRSVSFLSQFLWKVGFQFSFVRFLICLDDIDNQSASTIARQYDKNGTRTIGIHSGVLNLISGVLTKADTVGEGEYETWLKILKGKSHQLNLGYYVTRLPSQKEITWTWEQAREKERNFFQSAAPWCHVDKNRKGTERLTEALSVKLSQMIGETFTPSSRMN